MTFIESMCYILIALLSLAYSLYVRRLLTEAQSSHQARINRLYSILTQIQAYLLEESQKKTSCACKNKKGKK